LLLLPFPRGTIPILIIALKVLLILLVHAQTARPSLLVSLGALGGIAFSYRAWQATVWRLLASMMVLCRTGLYVLRLRTLLAVVCCNIRGT